MMGGDGSVRTGRLCVPEDNISTRVLGKGGAAGDGVDTVSDAGDDFAELVGMLRSRFEV